MIFISEFPPLSAQRMLAGRGVEEEERRQSEGTAIMVAGPPACKEDSCYSTDGHAAFHAPATNPRTERENLQRAAGCAKFELRGTMAKRKSSHPNFDQTLDLLRAHGFATEPYPGVPGSVLVSKQCVGAVLAPVPVSNDPEDAEIAFAVHPGIVVKDQVARLVDRGYQKFIKTSQYELPASASQLQAIHSFSEELKQLIGAISLYNESLGTTSDLYEYDRLKGREAAQPEPAQPWELADGH
jgi:hypothetical protein